MYSHHPPALPTRNCYYMTLDTIHHSFPLGTPSSSSFHGSTFSPSSCFSRCFSLSTVVAPEPRKQGVSQARSRLLPSSSLPLKARLLFPLGLQLTLSCNYT